MVSVSLEAHRISARTLKPPVAVKAVAEARIAVEQLVQRVRPDSFPVVLAVKVPMILALRLLRLEFKITARAAAGAALVSMVRTR